MTTPSNLIPPHQFENVGAEYSDCQIRFPNCTEN